MIASLPFLLGVATLSFASPVQVRAVTELNQEAFEEAHQRDDGATRAFSSTEIKTSDGQCLFIDELSGDFRANLTPIQLATCDGSEGQLWDIITSGKHNDVPGQMLVVNTLTQACLDFNQGRTGREVTAFSCGGRAAGEGIVSVDQLFTFPTTDSFTLTTSRGEGKCLAVVGSALGPAACSNTDAKQFFTIGGDAAPVTPADPVDGTLPSSTAAPADPSTSIVIEPTSTLVQSPVETPASSICIITTMVTVVGSATVSQAEAALATPTPVLTSLASEVSSPYRMA